MNFFLCCLLRVYPFAAKIRDPWFVFGSHTIIGHFFRRSKGPYNREMMLVIALYFDFNFLSSVIYILPPIKVCRDFFVYCCRVRGNQCT